MNDKINLTKMNGTNVLADAICFLEDTSNNKKYLYYTLNELVGTGTSSTVKIYVGKIKQNDVTLDAPITEDEWNKLKGFMGDALKDISNTTIKYLPLSELTEPVVVNERVIAMPTSYDYISKHRGIYVTAIATAPSVGNIGNEIKPTVEPISEVREIPMDDSIQMEPVHVVAETSTTPEMATQFSPTINTPTEETVEPIIPEVPVTEPNEPASNSENGFEGTSLTDDSQSTSLHPINIQEIEAKYAKMIENITNLKNQEIEAANRYNATIKLSAMHNEQHASYVANEQNKETTTITEAEINTPTSEPVTIEPTPVTPTVPEPSTTSTSTDIETNWFDMPIQG